MNKRIFLIGLFILSLITFYYYGLGAFIGWCVGVFLCVFIFWEFKNEYVALTMVMSSLKITKQKMTWDDRKNLIKKLFKIGR